MGILHGSTASVERAKAMYTGPWPSTKTNNEENSKEEKSGDESNESDSS